MAALTIENIEPQLYNALFHTSKMRNIIYSFPIYQALYFPFRLKRIIAKLERITRQIIELSYKISKEELERKRIYINKLLYELKSLSESLSELIPDTENLRHKLRFKAIIPKSFLLRLKNCQENIEEILENFSIALDPEMIQEIDERLILASQQFHQI